MPRFAVLVLLVAACQSDAGRPPVARIAVLPEAVPQHDAFTTDVMLDGTMSADPIDDPDGMLPLAYRWRISNDEARFQGPEDAAVTTIRLAGERPATIELTVTDADGDSTTARHNLQLTLP